MDRAQIIEDLRNWLALYASHEKQLEAWEVIAKINELEEWYE